MSAHDNDVVMTRNIHAEIDRLRGVRERYSGSSLAPGARLQHELISQRIAALTALLS